MHGAAPPAVTAAPPTEALAPDDPRVTVALRRQIAERMSPGRYAPTVLWAIAVIYLAPTAPIWVTSGLVAARLALLAWLPRLIKSGLSIADERAAQRFGIDITVYYTALGLVWCVVGIATAYFDNHGAQVAWSLTAVMFLFANWTTRSHHAPANLAFALALVVPWLPVVAIHRSIVGDVTAMAGVLLIVVSLPYFGRRQENALRRVIARELANEALAENLASARNEAEAARTEAEAAREAAEQATRRLDDAIRALPTGFALYDADDRLITSNHAYATYMGLPPGVARPGVAYMDVLRAVPPAPGLPTREESWYEAVLATHRTRGEREMESAGGGWVRVSKSATSDGGVATLITDLTDAKRREAELAEARAQAEQARAELGDALAALPVGVVVMDPDLRLMQVNAAFASALPGVESIHRHGTTLEDVLREIVRRGAATNITEGEHGERWIGWWRRELANPTGPFEGGLPNDRWGRYAASRTPLGNTVLTLSDITDLKTREAELARAKAAAEQARDTAETASSEAARARRHLLDAIEALNEPFVLHDADERLVVSNAAYRERMQHVPRAVAPGEKFEDGFRDYIAAGHSMAPPGYGEELLRRMMVLFRSGNADVVIPTKGGRWAHFRNRRTSDGGLVSMLSDVTAQRQREADLEHARDEAETANQAKSTFLATMSHEIRTPLNGVLGSAELMEREQLSERQRRLVGTVRTSATALLRIIDDVLDFSKIEAGRMELERAPFGLRPLVEGTVETLRVQAGRKGLDLSASVAADSLDALVGDATRVRQILFNLVGNAIKFTEVGSVRVAAQATGAADGTVTLCLSVSDTGIGMDGEQISRLFQPFAQADSSTTRRFGGTGLGLSIVRRLTQFMGGDVTVSSTPGKGSVFTATLTVEADAAGRQEQPRPAPAQMTAADAGEARLAGRVLAVDDYDVNLEVLAEQLDILGVAVDLARSGVEALPRWRNGGYALVLTDIHMPDMDGFELTRQIRTEEAGRGDGMRTPIVALTANALKGEAERCLAAGMDDYLTKPLTLDRLRAALDRWLAVPAADAPAAPIDRDAWSDLFGDNPTLITRMLGRFRDSGAQLVAKLEAQSAAGDLAAAAETAHTLKGIARAAGAAALGNLAEALEETAREGRGDRRAVQVSRITAEWRLVEAALESSASS